MGKNPRPRALGKKGQPNRVVFQGGVRIGFADAEDDTDYLHECYVDIDQVQQVLNTEDPGSILLGRTGCGKTAAIMHIVSVQDNVIQIEPETLSLNFISNSNILSFRGGSVSLNRLQAVDKWLSALVMPPPGLAWAG